MLFGQLHCLLAAVSLVAARPDLAQGIDSDLPVGAEALAADDECLFGGASPSPCAVDALQRSSKLVNASRIVPEKVETAVPGTCNATNPCEDLEDRCVSDGTWAQCVPSSASSFEAQCVKWTDGFRYAAIRLMKLTCPNTKCYSDEWCLDGMVCASQSDGHWAQCISCDAQEFQTNCYSWSDPFKIAAGELCERTCKHGWSYAFH
ncbi:unnamed protein product [Polarella glacialis]|uniref:Uncharacterized protein n=1 Tax=Polarella glacialis TaxID=89957 RepID=A0A813IMX3_POLGL|nr:unnamed protein product [Polarella glacialis]CAE8653441.1 unnamed protein product [Polarella glacialis]